MPSSNKILKQFFFFFSFKTCVKLPDCDINNVTNLLDKHIPNIKPTSNIGSELIYNLPEDKTAVFQKLLEDLENNLEKLQIESFGITNTTLEEVFMKIGTEELENEKLLEEKFKDCK